jgi:FKBP-type peptidyl-prolyl cis-trans isomerase SlyD
MEIKDNKVVGITYELRVGKSQQEKILVEKVDSSQTFYFLYGKSGLPEGFELKLGGKKEGEIFNFSLSVEEGFGQKDEEAIVLIPKDSFKIDGVIDQEMLKEGNFVPMVDDRGHQIQGKILKIEDDQVLVDFNHPLMGMELHFEGKVEEVRNATKEEIAHGHVHGPGGHHHH